MGLLLRMLALAVLYLQLSTLAGIYGPQRRQTEQPAARRCERHRGRRAQAKKHAEKAARRRNAASAQWERVRERAEKRR